MANKPKKTKVIVQNGKPLIVDAKFKPSEQKLRQPKKDK